MSLRLVVFTSNVVTLRHYERLDINSDISLFFLILGIFRIKKDGILYVGIKCNESALFYWYMQYSECVTIISPPQSLIVRAKKEAKKDP